MKTTLALSLVGIGAVATGALGIVLPAGSGSRPASPWSSAPGSGWWCSRSGRRSSATRPTTAPKATRASSSAAALGLIGTLVSLVLLWRRTADQRTAGGRADGAQASAPGEG